VPASATAVTRLAPGGAYAGWPHGDGDGLLALHGMKLFVDAGRYSAGPEGARSFRYPGTAVARDWVRSAHRAGLAVSLHALGDLDVREALDLIEAAQGDTQPPASTKTPRHRVIHARTVAPEDVRRLARLGVLVEAQPWDIGEQLPALEKRFPPAYLAGAYPLRTLLDAGVRVAFGSDWLIDHRADGLDLSPLAAIWLATTRTPHPRSEQAGSTAGAWNPEQRIGVAEAIACYTSAGAWAAGAEHRRGAMQVGMDADLMALSRDVVAEGPDALLEAQVRLTVVAGRVVYEAV